MRRSARLLIGVLLGAAALGGGCSDDEGTAPTTSDRVSREGICEVLDADRASAVLGVDFDEAVATEGACTYTSSTSPTAFTLQVTEEAADPALVLETMAGTCDEGTRREGGVRGADAGFRCLAGGVPNVVAAVDGVVLVITGNSREAGVSATMVLADLTTILGDAVAAYGSPAATTSPTRRS